MSSTANEILMTMLWAVISVLPLLLAYAVAFIILFFYAATATRRWALCGVMVMVITELLKIIMIISLRDNSSTGHITWLINFFSNFSLALGMVILNWGLYKAMNDKKDSMQT